MRAVFDSNIFISALVIPGSKAEKAIARIIEGKDRLVLSKAIIDEILFVLARKFSRDREAISRAAVYLSALGETNQPTKKIKVLTDDPDNRILECAQAGKADIIVTGDTEMLKLKEFHGIRIISLKEYLTS
ncbi:MAG TPA: putative toxin-antitoxin system toxin component, PIN family [Nitrospirae bacterium]|nr:tRNA(fMet)-specific endonuclease VapC [bacterium BMS3Bbin08]HDO25046.1 putative toxin-antitoxin system toxin component, PIN family [Nitrospirota bacterium]